MWWVTFLCFFVGSCFFCLCFLTTCALTILALVVVAGVVLAGAVFVCEATGGFGAGATARKGHGDGTGKKQDSFHRSPQVGSDLWLWSD